MNVIEGGINSKLDTTNSVALCDVNIHNTHIINVLYTDNNVAVIYFIQ